MSRPSVDQLNPDRLEFFRGSVALLPERGKKPAGCAVSVKIFGEFGKEEIGFWCDCGARGMCYHRKELEAVLWALDKGRLKLPGNKQFRASFWFRMGEILWEERDVPLATCEYETVDDGLQQVGCRKYGQNLLKVAEQACGGKILGARLGLADVAVSGSRAKAWKVMLDREKTESELKMNKLGVFTRGQHFERSLWFRLAYHGFRQWGMNQVQFELKPEDLEDEYRLIARDRAGEYLFCLRARSKTIRNLMPVLDGRLMNAQAAGQVERAFVVLEASGDPGQRLEVRPTVVLNYADGRRQVERPDRLTQVTVGDRLCLPAVGTLPISKPVPPALMQLDGGRTLTGDEVPQFLIDHAELLQDPDSMVPQELRDMRILGEPERLEMTACRLSRDWCWMDIQYVLGATRLDILTLIAARQKGQRFVPCDQGWVDCGAPGLLDLLRILKDRTADDDSQPGSLQLDRLDLFRLAAISQAEMRLIGGDALEAVTDMLSLDPGCRELALRGLKSELRQYQQVGLRWLMFLVRNQLGGLLCDDMGLGKTHQVMGLMIARREIDKVESPFLVVCPTTVLSHWEQKLAQHAPSLRVALYHGSERDLDSALDEADVVLTSYGILRRDAPWLSEHRFDVIAFDEVQHLKNPDTLGYRAAQVLKADVRLGLTGTPVENHLGELKALFDLVLPGYLGSTDRFEKQVVAPVEAGDGQALERLRRLIHPFTLRRLKEKVLDELPPKIEDVRTCHLSDEQAELYREAVKANQKLRTQLQDESQQVPYIHIFTLLGLLKQICDHPAVAAKAPAAYTRHASGKWELFVELLDEILDSGHKVVVFSHFLDMIEIIRLYLIERQVGHEVLTGASTNRGRLVKRFNEDPECRVFIASLQAGGTGIDLIGASVVIHYDRWWNAAREDQATDRVHRIGQTRGVQVFKLVTQGTLEEKIDALIERKRELMAKAVGEDSPQVLKTLSRQELLELVSLAHDA